MTDSKARLILRVRQRLTLSHTQTTLLSQGQSLLLAHIAGRCCSLTRPLILGFFSASSNVPRRGAMPLGYSVLYSSRKIIDLHSSSQQFTFDFHPKCTFARSVFLLYLFCLRMSKSISVDLSTFPRCCCLKIMSLCVMDDWKLKTTPVVRLQQPNKTFVQFLCIFLRR